jgi:SAM-dependent methyltransferase
VLNLGSGKKPRPGALNVDVTIRTRPDLVHDLDVTPWPLPDGHFTEVHAYDVIEHLQDVVRTMEEIHRVCAPAARVFITVPHFSSANSFTDPTHRHQFGARSMLYFTDEHELGFYSSARFLQRQALIVFEQSLLNKVVRRLAKRFVVPYEERWAWVFPAWFLFFELEALKPEPS